jgi:uncharacterized protein
MSTPKPETGPDLDFAGPRRLFAPGRKRVLALDGGGTRGIISIAFLAEIERRIREETGRKDLVLSDVFDQVGGTSVGSLLATMVSLGYPTAEMEKVFRELAAKIFTGRTTIIGQKRFDARPLVNGVRAIVKDRTLGSPDLRTGLVIVSKRVDTGSPWIMSNNPKMPYYYTHPGKEGWLGNRHYPLVNILRASTAAPYLFTPTEILIAEDNDGHVEKGWFADGGVSTHNNPAYQMLLMAGLPAYRLGWTLDPDNLLMISVGTGWHRAGVNPTRKFLPGFIRATLNTVSGRLGDDLEEAAFAASALRTVINDGAALTLKTMQALSTPRFSWRINSEIGDLSGETLLGAAGFTWGERTTPAQLLSFQRYDLPMERGRYLPGPLDIATGVDREELEKLQPIDDPRNMDRLYALAADCARRQVSFEDFAKFV